MLNHLSNNSHDTAQIQECLHCGTEMCPKTELPDPTNCGADHDVRLARSLCLRLIAKLPKPSVWGITLGPIKYLLVLSCCLVPTGIPLHASLLQSLEALGVISVRLQGVCQSGNERLCRTGTKSPASATSCIPKSTFTHHPRTAFCKSPVQGNEGVDVSSAS